MANCCPGWRSSRSSSAVAASRPVVPAANLFKPPTMKGVINMSLTDRLREYVSACFTAIWIQSHEQPDALTEIAQLCRELNWGIAVWDIDQGLQLPGQSEHTAEANDPLAAVRAASALATPEGTALLVLANFHRFLQSAEIVQALARQIQLGKHDRTFVVVLAPVVEIPTELEKMFVVIEHDLPSREQLAEIASGIATEEGELPEDAELDQVLDAAAGLTRFEAEGAFALSLVREQRLAAPSIWDIKSQQLKKSGLVSLHRGGESFHDLGGLGALKSFCLRSMRRQGHHDPLRRPRGVLLLGVPGTGKSAICKALGNETGRPTLILDVGSLLGSLVGDTERNIRQALQLIDAMQPAVVMVDEIEKALAGAANSGQTDSGVSARLFGTFLTWLSDRESDTYCVATSNNIAQLPPEFSRAERWDAIFFLDLPSAQQRQKIWDIYMPLFDLDPDQPRPQDDNYTGAEIRACCRLANLLDLPLTAAAQNVVPVASTAAESVERLRTWASGRCLDADHGGLYRHTRQSGGKRRRISVDPSSN